MGLNESQKKERSEYLENNLAITECSQKKPFVFISYASDNWETVFKTAVVPMQQQYGLCVYADKAFDKVNDKWIVPMLRNIRGADAVIAFVSQSYIESYACFLELLTAVNNKKQIIFVSLEDSLHLGNTTDQPNVERGVKNEILNQGANIATNTNNTSNDIMRAMKSAYTSISTLLEQDALSKYDISDAFINFFRDASINRKTINDLNAVKGTIESVSESVFDKAFIGQALKANNTPKSEKPVPAAVGASSAESSADSVNIRNSDERTTAAGVQPPQKEQPQNAPPSAHAQQADKPGFNLGNKKFLIAAACVLAVAVMGIIIGVSGGGKNVTDKVYSYISESDGQTLSGTYTGEWKNNRPEGKGTMKYYNGTVYEGDWVNGLSDGFGIFTANDGVYEGEFKEDLMSGQGTMTLANGNVYVGEFANNAINGYGTMTYADGSVYEGEWIDNKRHGQCTDTFANGNVYTGEFTDDAMTGQGTLTYADGSVYEGKWLNGRKHGQGTLTYADGSVYTGEWKDDKRNGQGTLTYADGSVYTGEWKDSKENGQGTLTYADGSVYTGEWKDDKRNGQGTLTYADDGTEQKGIWENGEYIGDPNAFGAPKNITAVYSDDQKVTLSWDAVPGAEKYHLYHYTNPELENCDISTTTESNSIDLTNVYKDIDYYYFKLWAERTTGDGKSESSDITYIQFRVSSDNVVSYYFGGWKDGKRDGEGTQINPGGTDYTGEWKNDMWNGSGKASYATGDTYEGELVNNQYNGQGTLTYVSGNVYTGEWKDNKKNGQGTLTYADGTVQTGEWKDDAFVQ